MKHLESNLPASNKQAMSRHFLQNAFQIQDSTFTFTISHSIYCSPHHLYHQHMKSVLKYCVSIEFHLSNQSALSYVCLFFHRSFVSWNLYVWLCSKRSPCLQSGPLACDAPEANGPPEPYLMWGADVVYHHCQVNIFKNLMFFSSKIDRGRWYSPNI